MSTSPYKTIGAYPTKQSTLTPRQDLFVEYGLYGCKHRLDAAQNIVESGGAVSQWTDMLDPRTIYTQSTLANKPLLVNEPLLNNLPALSMYDGITYRVMYALYSQYAMSCSSKNWVVAVVGTNLIMGGYNYNALWIPLTFWGHGNQRGVWQLWKNFTGYDMGVSMVNNAASIVIFTNNQMYVNGVDIATSTYRASPPVEFNFWLSISRVTADGWKGRIAEILVYEGVYSNTDLLALSTTLNNKYLAY